MYLVVEENSNRIRLERRTRTVMANIEAGTLDSYFYIDRLGPVPILKTFTIQENPAIDVSTRSREVIVDGESVKTIIGE